MKRTKVECAALLLWLRWCKEQLFELDSNQSNKRSKSTFAYFMLVSLSGYAQALTKSRPSTM